MPPAANLRDFIGTTKPRVVGLTVVTAGTAVVLTGGLPALTFAAVLIGTALTVGGAGALNHYLERDRDRLMVRTRTRPLPGGRLNPHQVLRFGVGLVTGGILLLLVTAGWLSALFAGLGVACYLLVYTILLKPRSPRSVVPGGVAGVFPPLIGWAATGRPLSLAVVYLCGIVFFWSPPHFWALALARRDDYARAGIPALPVVRGSLATRQEMAAYTLALVGLSVLPVANGTFGLGYLFPALVGGAALAVLGLSVAHSDSAGLAWLFYRVSGPYLALLLAAMLLDHLTGSPTLGTPGWRP